MDNRSEFLKYIRQTIRDSVRKMTIPKTRHIERESNRHRHSVNTDSSLSTYHDPEPTSHLPVSTKQDNNRHSMNIDVEKLSIPDLHNGRSRTYGDLAFNDKLLECRNMSRNSVSSDISQGSQGAARLVYSSQDPLSYHSSKSSLDCTDSPVWQKRSDSSSESIENGYRPSADDKRSLRIHGVYIDTATEC